jgi:hypothetical protein
MQDALESCRVLVLRLRFEDPVRDKLGRRDISLDHASQVVLNAPVVIANPRGRAPGSRFMIGPDDGGRILTLVIEPLSDETWNVRTGWPASRAQIVLYRRRRR